MIRFPRTLLPALIGVGSLAALGGCETVPTSTPDLASQQIAVLKHQGFVRTSNGWALSMDDRLLFPSDQGQINADQATKITQMAGALLGVGITQARIEGYADSTGSDAYNDALSQQRAQAVADVVARSGFLSANLTVTGRGARDPVETNATAAGRAQNRRVVILVSTIG